VGGVVPTKRGGGIDEEIAKPRVKHGATTACVDLECTCKTTAMVSGPEWPLLVQPTRKADIRPTLCAVLHRENLP
jgi:hypothetical protein